MRHMQPGSRAHKATRAPAGRPHPREDVRWLQRRLNLVRGLRLPLHGVLDVSTRSAVRAFQQDQGLPDDGVLGPETQQALQEAPAVEDVARPQAEPPSTAEPTQPPEAELDEEQFLSGLYALTSAAKRGLYDAVSSLASVRAPGVQPTAASATRLPLPESVLAGLIPQFRDYVYHRTSTYYPWPLPGIALPQAPPKQLNCCTFAEALIVGAWAKQYGSSLSWGSRRHAQMMVLAEDLFSPVTAVTEAELATAVPPGQPPSDWCLAQSWRDPQHGHTFIIVARHAPSDRLLVLEANDYDAVSGVGYRGLGNLRDFPGCRPPARWWENSAAPTWRALLASSGAGIKLAKLNVTQPSWAALKG